MRSQAASMACGTPAVTTAAVGRRGHREAGGCGRTDWQVLCGRAAQQGLRICIFGGSRPAAAQTARHSSGQHAAQQGSTAQRSADNRPP